MLQETNEIKLLKRNKELLDKLYKLKLYVKELEKTNEGLIKINNEKENSILKALFSLTFYSNKDNYDDYEEFGEPSTIEVDNGKRAREAIKVIKNNA